jgi:predicted lipoprotein with Yx(FWY)xxD motif
VVRRMILLFVPFLLLLALSSVAVADDTTTVSVKQDPTLGAILVDPKGMTIYWFMKDTAGTSTCYGGCAAAWPPLLATGALSLPAGTPGVLGTSPRTDGTSQVTYNGQPVYYYAKDTKPGDTTGQNVGKVWFVIAPKDMAAKLPASGGTPIEFVLIGGVALLGAGLRLRKRVS